MAEKNWPQATVHSVEKVEKRVDKLEKDADKLAKDTKKISDAQAKLDKRLDGIQEAASATALIASINNVATAIHKRGGLNEEEELEVFHGLASLVNKLKNVGSKTGAKVSEKGETIMAVPTIQEYRDLLSQADAETNRIATRIAELMAGVQPGLSEADANEIKAGLQAVVDELKGVGVAPTP